MSYQKHTQDIADYEADPKEFRLREYKRKLAELDASLNAKIVDVYLKQRIEAGVMAQKEKLRRDYEDVLAEQHDAA